MIQTIFRQFEKFMDYIQEVKINYSFQIQTSQVFKKELLTLVLKYIIVCPAIFKALRIAGNNLKMNYTGIF